MPADGDTVPKTVPETPGGPGGLGFREFVALVAAVMAVNAIAVDAMLPAFPLIGQAFGLADPNRVQLIVTVYLLGFGAAQILYGPLSDRFGRRPVLLASLLLYAGFGVVAAFAASFDQLLVARAFQGIAAAGTRVLAVSIIRDCYSGRAMARVMSLAFIIFIMVPVVAPSLGQAVVLLAPWPSIFLLLGAFGGAVGAWVALRLPGVLAPAARRPLTPAAILGGFRIVLTTRITLGYTLAMTLVFGSLFGFVASGQQVFVDVLGFGRWFAVAFGSVALSIAASSFVNARIVERLGMRRVSHGALAGFTAIAAVHLAVALAGLTTPIGFMILVSAMLFCFGLTMGNFGSVAMEPVGHVAGTASSVQGFVTTVGGALLGYVIGQSFDGTVVPLTLGFAVLGAAAFAVIAITERGRLFGG